ncbi:ATP-dependent DNA helicase [Salicola sp. Rm-C-2C1-2]|uniref:ATP-dependent DNA helicase n=1 Tax=Salicola sp. Rm-C-2C1-2 TaxID=3141321 RepID=UPI0032E51453
MRVAVRTLCEFAARTGDLDYRYTPSPTSEEGIAGHARVQARRGTDYHSEYQVSGSCEGVALTGRIDGYDPVVGRIEEIKTHRGDLDRLSGAQKTLHRAQLRAYGALLCDQEGRDELELALIYYDTARDRETPLVERATRAELQGELRALSERFLTWWRNEERHRQARDKALGSLGFPHKRFRSGQRGLAEAVYRNGVRHHTLMLEAPTGLGKTLGTLYPALMAMPRANQDRLFYLTARNTTRRMALESIQALYEYQQDPLPLRVLELVAKEHACEHPDKACHGESCPLASGFFDRLPLAREAAANHRGLLTQDVLADIAAAHNICPYFLGHEMARWSDVTVADVNRFFDQSALLHGLVRQNDWKASVLIDEAQNLIDRARGMYSVELSQARLLRARRQPPTGLKSPMDRVARAWQSLAREQSDDTPVFLDAIPQALVGALLGLISAITDYLTEHPPDTELQELLFESLAFTRLAESFGDHSLCQWEKQGRGKGVLRIQNLIPADFLAPRFASADSLTLFSATLSPGVYHRDLLGLPEATHWQSLPSPFSAEQLRVRMAPHISTRKADRDASLKPIARIIADQFREKPGNYLAFFSSFAYMEAVESALEAQDSEIPRVCQRPGMSVDQRHQFLDSFTTDSQKVGFGVLGGIFGEGIDLPGERLIGAFIVTLGLPPFDPWHEVLKERLQRRFSAGYEYTYLYPGLQKVAQAAGRVIRTDRDEGLIWLIDDRFALPRVRQMLPGWWFGVPTE